MFRTLSRFLLMLMTWPVLFRLSTGFHSQRTYYRCPLIRLTSIHGNHYILTRFSSNEPNTEVIDRRKILKEQLTLLHIDAEELDSATLLSIQDPTAGYDGRYGKSVIRTYRAFLYPKKSQSYDPVQLNSEAGRCARQIDFLLKRHKSHQTEWVRHHDALKLSRQLFPIILVLDNIRSAFNVGSLFRTADAAGCALVLTTGICPNPRGNGADKVAKSALGAEQTVATEHFRSTRDAISYCRLTFPNYQIVAMETTDRSTVYTSVEYNRNGIVVVLGNEVTGVDTEILSLLDDIVEIPMFGAKNSLNVAACAPVVLYEILRQWNVVKK